MSAGSGRPIHLRFSCVLLCVWVTFQLFLPSTIVILGTTDPSRACKRRGTQKEGLFGWTMQRHTFSGLWWKWSFKNCYSRCRFCIPKIWLLQLQMDSKVLVYKMIPNLMWCVGFFCPCTELWEVSKTKCEALQSSYVSCHNGKRLLDDSGKICQKSAEITQWKTVYEIFICSNEQAQIGIAKFDLINPLNIFV